jgi:signal transduction histidine kinase
MTGDPAGRRANQKVPHTRTAREWRQPVRDRRELSGADPAAHEGVEALIALATRLLRGSEDEAALRAGVDTMYEGFSVPAAGWMRGTQVPEGLYQRGIRRDLTQIVRRAVDARNEPSGAGGAVGEPGIKRLGGRRTLTVADAGEARLLILNATEPSVRALGRVAELVAAALDRTDPDSAIETAPNARMGLAWAAHEIRGPLVEVSAVIDDVLSGKGIGKKDLLRRSQQELDHLAQLVDPLLRLSPMSGHPFAARADLVEVVDHVLESPEFERERDRMVVASAGSVVVLGDEGQLRIAVANLIRNAVAYSPAESAVVITVSGRDDRALVSVLDGGPGIREEDRKYLFEPFVRGLAPSTGRGGSGLGLYIGRSIVEAHGGSLSFEPWSGGSVFRIELPLEPEGRFPSAS